MPTTDTLDSEIRSLIAELMDSAPLAISPQELEGRVSHQSFVHSRRAPWSRPCLHPRLLVNVVGTVTIALVALLLVLLLPGSGGHQPIAAGSELRSIAANVATQSPPPLGKGQWLATEERVSLSAKVSEVGKTLTPNAQATVSATIKEWTDPYGDVCISATSGPAQFSSPIDQAAWQAAGVLVNPHGQPVITCTSVQILSSGNADGGGGVIDVSTLPTDPT